MDISIKKLFRSLDFRQNKIFNARVETPTHDEHIANRLYVDNSHIKQITVVGGDYSTILTTLTLYTKAGNIVFIDSLGIAVKYNGSTWSYFKGVYTVANETSYNTIPTNLLKTNEIVIVGGSTQKIILTDLTLSDPIIVSVSIPATPEDNRYYLIGGILYYSFGGDVFKLSSGIYTASITTINGYQNIVHSLKSSYVLVYLRIDTTDNITLENNVTIPLDYIFIDVDTISIKTGLIVSGTIIVLTN